MKLLESIVALSALAASGLASPLDTQHLLKLQKGGGNLLDQLSEQLGGISANIPHEAYQIWSELASEYPQVLSKAVKTLKAELAPKKPQSPKKAAELAAMADKWLHTITDKAFPGHTLRAGSPGSIGLGDTKQYSGYLDVEDGDKHLFYWFFESRGDPLNDPLLVWVNGGPGCSSMTGLLFENIGPGSISPELTVINHPEWAWNQHANVVFLDEPVNVGFSYSSNTVDNTRDAAKDVYAFLSLFFKQFPQYSGKGLHIAGESYGGHYVPAFATEIQSHEDRPFNLTSILVGNGITDPYNQMPAYKKMACGEGGYPSVLSPQECDSMERALPRCQRMIEACYNSLSAWVCVPANYYCDQSSLGPYMKHNLNPYDIRMECEDSNLCYVAMNYIDEWLNKPEVQSALGARETSFESCSNSVGTAFSLTGDGSKPFHRDIADLLEQEIPVLIYAGDKDFICNWVGNEMWTNALEWSGGEEFRSAEVRDWYVNDTHAGTVQSYEHFTFLRVFDAGHMVPFNQPDNTLSMVNTWINKFRF
ncbi:carboxypeptidase Y [Trichomonascus vanleenenianus]|uniref:S10 family peptidase n=1 Tax=Trichomonascus vanleenenianus TaxID=2268995 RepID=UPI003EC9630E